MVLINLAQDRGTFSGFCDCGKELAGSIKYMEVFEQLMTS
jgi:hypothetical protein